MGAKQAATIQCSSKVAMKLHPSAKGYIVNGAQRVNPHEIQQSVNSTSLLGG